MRENPSKSLFWMLGGQIEGVSFEEMLDFWIVSGRSINSMYAITVKTRDGSWVA